jgi:dTMP kinase
MNKNLFIALEGIDGSGKSTQLNLLKEKLEAAGHNVYTTREPTDRPIGKMIRSFLTHQHKADEKVIAALFVADRLDHLLNNEDGILKKLGEGYTVITDRYYLSSYAYQASFIDVDWIINANSLSANLRRPDVNIYIDITPRQSLERINKGREATELYENLDNLTKVRNKYLEIIELLKGQEKVLTINGNQTPEMISNEIWDKIGSQF